MFHFLNNSESSSSDGSKTLVLLVCQKSVWVQGSLEIRRALTVKPAEDCPSQLADVMSIGARHGKCEKQENQLSLGGLSSHLLK